ncbi:hypothetical protein GCM10027160_31980 [Streptomyces calidiresistens]
MDGTGRLTRGAALGGPIRIACTATTVCARPTSSPWVGPGREDVRTTPFTAHVKHPRRPRTRTRRFDVRGRGRLPPLSAGEWRDADARTAEVTSPDRLGYAGERCRVRRDRVASPGGFVHIDTESGVGP